MSEQDEIIRNEAQQLVVAAREIRDVVKRFDLADKDVTADLCMCATYFAGADGMHDGYVLTVTTRHPIDEKSRLAFSIHMDEQMERLSDDELSVVEAAERGLET